MNTCDDCEKDLTTEEQNYGHDCVDGWCHRVYIWDSTTSGQ